MSNSPPKPSLAGAHEGTEPVGESTSLFLSITFSFLMRSHNLRRNFSLRSSLSLFFFCTFGIHSVCQIEIMDQFSLSTAWNDCEIFFEAQGCSEWSSIVFRPSEGRQNYAGVLSLHISHLSFP